MYITGYCFFKGKKKYSQFKTRKDYLFFEKFRRETTYCYCSKMTQIKIMNCYPNQKIPLIGGLFFGLKIGADSHLVLTDFGVKLGQFKALI